MLVTLLTSLLAAAPAVQRFDPATGQLTLQRGIQSAPLTGELSSAARLWALSKRTELGLPPDSTLDNADSFGTRFGASFHLQQRKDGIEVYGAQLVVTLDAQARVQIVSSSLFNYRTAQTVWSITSPAAMQIAAHQVPLPALKADGTPYGGATAVYFPVGVELRAGWIVQMPTVDIRHNWFVGIDAATGEVLSRQDRVFHAALDANAYNPSPGGPDAGVGVTPTIKVQLMHSDGGSMVLPDAGGYLTGTQLDTYNCCANKGCDTTAADAGPKRAAGMTMLPYMGFNVNVNYDVVECDRLQRANNTVALHPTGSYEYTPVDPPTSTPPVQTDPTTSDEFAEVHSFYQVNIVHDHVRSLSAAATPLFPGNQPAITPFQLRDEKKVPPAKMATWVNIIFPDFNVIVNNPACILNGVCKINTYTRIDNAAFLPVESGAQIPCPTTAWRSTR